MKHEKLIITLFAVSILSNCGGSSLVGTDTKKEEKKSEKGDEEQTSATDPKVVTGTFLACENIPQPSEQKSNEKGTGLRLKSENDSERVGCNVLESGNRRAPKSTETYNFVANTNGVTTMPVPANNNSGNYHAVFALKQNDITNTKFEAKILENGTEKMYGDCDGKSLPCTGILFNNEMLLNTIGLWTPATMGKMASQIAMSPLCPNNPDYFCSNSNTLLNVPPASQMDSNTSTACAGVASILNGAIAGITGINIMNLLDGAPQPYSSYTLNKGNACIVRKKTSVSDPTASLLMQGTKGCFMIMVNKNNQVNNLILSPQNVGNPAQMEADLERFACP